MVPRAQLSQLSGKTATEINWWLRIRLRIEGNSGESNPEPAAENDYTN